MATHSTADSAPAAILVPRLEVTPGAPDPVAISTWHLALSNLVGAEIPHQLFALWVFPERGKPVLLGPAALSQDRVEVPSPEPRLSQDQLFELEERLRRAKYASAVAVPVAGADRDVGLALIGTFEPGTYGPAQVRRLRQIGAGLVATLDPLSRAIRGEPGGSAIAPPVPGDELPDVVATTVAESPTGPELVRRLSGLLHAHLPHDRLELIAFANGTGASLPLSGAPQRRRWGSDSQTWSDLARGLERLIDGQAAVSIADLGAEADLAWPGGGTPHITSVLAAPLVLGERTIGLLVLGHAGTDVYRPVDEAIAVRVARLASGRVAALRLEMEVQALRGQLEVLQAPTLPVLRAAEALASTAHLGEALHRFAHEVREIIPHRSIRYLLRWNEAELVSLSADAIRPLSDVPAVNLESLPERPVLDGERAWQVSPREGGVELAVPLRVADRAVGVMVIEAEALASPRDAAAAAQQFAGVIAPHLELVRRSATGAAVRMARAPEPARQPAG